MSSAEWTETGDAWRRRPFAMIIIMSVMLIMGALPQDDRLLSYNRREGKTTSSLSSVCMLNQQSVDEIEVSPGWWMSQSRQQLFMSHGDDDVSLPLLWYDQDEESIHLMLWREVTQSLFLLNPDAADDDNNNLAAPIVRFLFYRSEKKKTGGDDILLDDLCSDCRSLFPH